MDFDNGKGLLMLCEEHNLKISEVMLKRELSNFNLNKEQAIQKMHTAYDIMRASISEALNTPKKSMGGLIGGEAAKMQKRMSGGISVCGGITSKAVMYAMAVMEVNACMGLIVAAPTAGSSGVVPGTFLAVQEQFGFSDNDMIHALFTASAIGYIITKNASVSGAAAGCQAEVGSASAMAAAAIAELLGASPAACISAAGMALSNLLGLVCDPIRGLVEEPCQKRNAIGASNALICAEIALSDINFVLPFDEMVEVMYKVGTGLPHELRETSLGGMAVAPSVMAEIAKVIIK